MTPMPAAPAPKKGMPGWLIAVIAAVVAVGCCIPGVGIVAAIAIPNFIRFQARSKQAECKVQLKAIYTAERSLYAEKDLYSENPEQLGVSVSGKYYVYVLGRSGAPLGNATNAVALASDAAARAAGHLGVEGKCPDCQFTAACAGNIDQDSETDVWSISSADRRTAEGRAVPAGVPFNDFSDVTDAPGN
jgi:type IV pilus assembly protein PilA